MGYGNSLIDVLNMGAKSLLLPCVHVSVSTNFLSKEFVEHVNQDSSIKATLKGATEFTQVINDVVNQVIEIGK